MKLWYGNFLLADSTLLEGVYGFTLNGQQVNDRFDLARAGYSTFHPRGNRSYALGFSVRPNKDSVRAACRHVLQHFADLPEQADLSLEIGEGGDTEIVKFAGAVIDAVPAFFQGTSPGFQYNFSVGEPQFDQPPPDVPDVDDEMKRGTQAIADAATTVAVVFGTAFSGTPTVVATVLTPDGADYMTCDVIDSSISATGFTARLVNGPAPGAGYKLSWMAIL